MEGVMDPLSPYSKAGWVLCAHFTEERTGSDSRRGVGTCPRSQGELLAGRLHPLTSPHPPLFPWPLSRDKSSIHSLTHSLIQQSLSGPHCGLVLGARNQDHLFWNCPCTGGMAKEPTADATASPSP